MPPRSDLYQPQWTLVEALRLFLAPHKGETVTMTEAEVRRITGMGNAIRPALREAGFVNPREGVWVRPA